MIQVDVFWSLAMGAAFASLAPEGIKRSKSMFVNKYFVYNVCFLSMIFAPSGIYLLWHHTGWESMFFLDKSLHGIWPCIFAHTNVSLGVLGFCICYKLIKAGQEQLTHFVWTGAYTCMFAILTFGYDRFMYAGTLNEWRAGVQYKITDFFQCEVFHALLVMSVFVLPFLYYPMATWPQEFGITKHEKKKLIRASVMSYLWASGVVVAVFNVVFWLEYTPKTWGYDRLVAFVVGQMVFGSLIFFPIFVVFSGKGDTKKK